MKRILSVLAVLVLCAAAPLALAQGKASANIPFEFSVAGKAMPAGNYEISKPSQFTILVQNRDNHEAAIATTISAEEVARGEGRLVFHKYGDTYFLNEVWSAGGAGKQLPTSKLEKEMMAAAKDKGAEPAVVALK